MDRLKYRQLFTILKKLPLITGFLLLGLLSCGDEYFFGDVDCDECYTPEPNFGPVTITVSLNSENDSIPVRIFKGKYQDSFRNDLDKAFILDTLTETNTIYDLDVNEYYSVTAEYNSNGKKTIVVDGDKLKKYKVSDTCEDICWIFRGGEIDVSLKK